MRVFLIALFLNLSVISFAQTTLKGKVLDEQKQPISGANVYIKGSYDGGITDKDGNFTFETKKTGTQTIVFSFLGFENLSKTVVIETYKPETFVLKEVLTTLNTVEVTAGTFKAGDNSKANALKPLDIVTTAGSAGNIIAALETLPGTQTVGESGRLFVRGGEDYETQTYIDGLHVSQPYTATGANMPARGRFSPFIFKGITFSTGGYSAEFGNALSGVLLLNSFDEPEQNQTDISLMTVGLGLGRTKKWNKSSLSVNTSYINLAPYQAVIKQNLDWNKAAQSAAGEAIYRLKTKKGILKTYIAFDYSDFDVNQPDINYALPIQFALENRNLYANTTYKTALNSSLQVQTGVSFGNAHNSIKINTNGLQNNENALHYKLKFKYTLTNRIKFNAGGDYFYQDFDETYNTFTYGFKANHWATFAESELLFSKNVGLTVGLRTSNHSIIKKQVVEPRVILAYKHSKNGQFSVAFGTFNQSPITDYLKFTDKIANEQTIQYLFNYLYQKEGRTFRAELYYKKYENLVKYNSEMPQYNSVYSNSGDGFAQGLDIFWRDNKTFKNLEYWFSYSYIDTEKDFRYYPKSVTPSTIATHSASLVTKYWIEKLRSQLGLTYSFNSGRPYNNPNTTDFMNGQTKCYNNFSLGWAYLLSQQKIIYFSASNLLNSQNVFGYNYANSPNTQGVFERQAITQTANRFFFVGFFWTISDNKKTNQLDNL